MSVCRYKNLMSYLPGMASVVNAFQSAEVQAEVYRELMKALEMRLEQDGVPPAPTGGRASELKQLLTIASQARQNELELDLVEGDSIHSAPLRP
ncbi:MAG: hypothetical protein SFV23_02695 [Planctomycetaceae bacterium]|nr:hypothetical protein [Planctomycetaceae bacterium]